MARTSLLIRWTVPLAAVLAACSDATAPERVLEIEIAGRVERSLTVQASARFEGQPVDQSSIEWSADPAANVQILPAGQISFISEGPVTLMATAELGDGRTESATIDLDVPLPPMIVFDNVVNGNRDIYTVLLDGGGLDRLTSATTDDQDPTAADASVVFTSFRDGNGELYAVPLAGGAPTRLTNTPDDEIQPTLFPGGDRLAYTANPTGVFKLWTAQADGSGAQLETATFGIGGSIEASPSWAPSGENLVFVSTTNGTSDLFTHDTPTGATAELFSGTTAEVEPAWSPDGAFVVFASNTTGDTEIFLLELTTMDLTQLTSRPEADGEPAWLPDGRIVFTSWTAGTPELMWLDPTTPNTVFSIPTPGDDPRRPAGVLGDG